MAAVTPGVPAIAADVPVDRHGHVVPRFPTRSEVWLELLEAYGL